MLLNLFDLVSFNVNVVVCIISRFIIDGVVDLCRVADQLDLVLELMQSLIGFVWFVSLQLAPLLPHEH